MWEVEASEILNYICNKPTKYYDLVKLYLIPILQILFGLVHALLNLRLSLICRNSIYVANWSVEYEL